MNLKERKKKFFLIDEYGEYYSVAVTSIQCDSYSCTYKFFFSSVLFQCASVRARARFRMHTNKFKYTPINIPK